MKVLFLAPHLSTGGMPAFLLKRIQALKEYTDIEIHVIEWKCYSMSYTVQRSQIQELVGNNFISFLGDKNAQHGIIDYCYSKQIDIIHIEEIPEGFDSFNKFDPEIQKKLYDPTNPWKIVETCHNIYFNPKEKKLYEPDGYACVTPHHISSTFKDSPASKSLISFPIDPSIQSLKTKNQIKNEMGWALKGEYHIITIGLWTSGKNQKYAIDMAKKLWNKYRWTYIFHFIGNQAPNFEKYWRPLMEDLPKTVRIHGEKSNVDEFYKMADLMLFPSTWECNPIVLKEAISNNIKIMANNLDHYGDEYTPFITNLTGNLNTEVKNLINDIHSPIKYNNSDIKNDIKTFALNHIKFYKNLNGKRK